VSTLLMTLALSGSDCYCLVYSDLINMSRECLGNDGDHDF
jgi:hypothetical protein